MDRREFGRWRHAAWEFVRDAFHPPWLRRFAWVWTGLTVVAVFGPAAIAAGESALPSVVVIGLPVIVIVGLFLMEGVRLQKASRDRAEPRFSVRSFIDRLGVPLTVGEEVYKDNFLLWVRVENDGPAADFSARLVLFRGLPGVSDLTFEMPEAAWEHSLEGTVHLARGGFSRLRIGAMSLDPRALWFYGAKSATWSPNTHQAGERFLSFYGKCTFDIVIHDETHDLTRRCSATITVASDGTLGFCLDEGGKNLGMHVMAPERPVLGGDAGPSGLGK